MQILGLGAQTELSTIIRLAEREYRVAHNIPARLSLQAGNVEIEVHRLEKDDTWVGGSVRIATEAESGAAETLKAVHHEFPDTSSLTEETANGVSLPTQFARDGDKPNVAKKLSLLWAWPETWRVSGDDFEIEAAKPGAVVSGDG